MRVPAPSPPTHTGARVERSQLAVARTDAEVENGRKWIVVLERKQTSATCVRWSRVPREEGATGCFVRRRKHDAVDTPDWAIICRSSHENTIRAPGMAERDRAGSPSRTSESSAEDDHGTHLHDDHIPRIWLSGKGLRTLKLISIMVLGILASLSCDFPTSTKSPSAGQTAGNFVRDDVRGQNLQPQTLVVLLSSTSAGLRGPLPAYGRQEPSPNAVRGTNANLIFGISPGLCRRWAQECQVSGGVQGSGRLLLKLPSALTTLQTLPSTVSSPPLHVRLAAIAVL